MLGRNFSVIWDFILFESIFRGFGKYFLIKREKKGGEKRRLSLYIKILR